MSSLQSAFHKELGDSVVQNAGKICLVTLIALGLAVAADVRNLPDGKAAAGLLIRLFNIVYFFGLFGLSLIRPGIVRAHYDRLLAVGGTSICLGVALIGAWSGNAGSTYFVGILQVEFGMATFLTMGNPWFMAFVLISNGAYVAAALGAGLTPADELVNISVSLSIFAIVSVLTNRIIYENKFQSYAQRRRLTDILESISEAFMALDENCRLTYLNRQAVGLFARDSKHPEQLLGRPIWDIYPALIDDSLFFEKCRVVLATKQPQKFEEYFPKLNGYFELHLFPSDSGLSVYAHEVTERRLNEAEIRQSLDEKDVLLRHIHHGVKNNLQMISSLLSLQSQHLSNPGEKETLLAGQHRIKTIALVHEILYGSRNMSVVMIREFLGSLTSSLAELYVGDRDVTIETQIADETLDMETAIYCGLVVNELLTNALKYATLKEGPTLITVSMRTVGGELEGGVKDNGPGLPPGFDPLQGKSLGLRLARILVEKQLHGALFFSGGNKGLTAIFTFPKKQ